MPCVEATLRGVSIIDELLETLLSWEGKSYSITADIPSHPPTEFFLGFFSIQDSARSLVSPLIGQSLKEHGCSELIVKDGDCSCALH